VNVTNSHVIVNDNVNPASAKPVQSIYRLAFLHCRTS
jgi:hypothetical protein